MYPLRIPGGAEKADDQGRGVRADPSPELLQTWKWSVRGEECFWLRVATPRDKEQSFLKSTDQPLRTLPPKKDACKLGSVCE